MFNIVLKNLMTGQGFEGGSFGSAWIMAWVGLFILAVLIMLSKRWLEEEQVAGMPYSFFGGFLGPLVYFIVISLTGQAKWALLIGLIGMGIGGFGAGRFANG
jgi:TM2 domain-containing membrane protein YozV